MELWAGGSDGGGDFDGDGEEPDDLFPLCTLSLHHRFFPLVSMD